MTPMVEAGGLVGGAAVGSRGRALAQQSKQQIDAWQKSTLVVNIMCGEQ